MDKHQEFAKLPLINIIKKGALLAFTTVADESYPLKKVYPQNLVMPFLGSLKKHILHPSFFDKLVL